MRKFFKSFYFAGRGIIVSVREQFNLRIQIAITTAVVTLGIYFQITTKEWALIILSIGLVLGFELMNTAIENLVDLVTVERKPLAGKIKDIAAGAVLIVSISALIIGWLIFKPYFFAD